MGPTEMKIRSRILTAQSSYVGSFLLSDHLVEKISTFHKIVPRDNPPDGIIFDGGIYHGSDPANPQIGDLRVSFEYAGLSGADSSPHGPPAVVSVIAKQHQGPSLMQYQTDAGDPLEILYLGEFTAEKIFDNEHAQNTMMTWGLRFAGWLLMFIAFQCMTQIIVTLVDWIPLVRNLVAMGMTSLSAMLAIS